MTIPPRADLKVGFACNNRCVFCAQGDKRDACGAVDLDALVARLTEVRPHTRGLVLTGGEPALYKQILPLVRAARALGFAPIQLQTNGRMLSLPRVLSALVAAGVTEFSPSLHGSTPETHDALTHAEGSWTQSLQGLRAALGTGLPVVTNSVITRRNLDDIPTLVELLGAVGVRQAQLAFVHPVGTAYERFDEVVPRLPDVVPQLARARAVARKYAMRLVAEAVPYCFLRGMEELCVEGIIPPTTVVDLDGRPADHTAWRVDEGKSHGPCCEGCARRARCEGPWREYPERFGWGEFVPIADAAARGSSQRGESLP